MSKPLKRTASSPDIPAVTSSEVAAPDAAAATPDDKSAKKTKTIVGQITQLEQQAAEIATLTNTNTALNTQNRALNTQLADQTAENRTLTAQNSTLNEDLKTCKEELTICNARNPPTPPPVPMEQHTIEAEAPTNVLILFDPSRLTLQNIDLLYDEANNIFYTKEQGIIDIEDVRNIHENTCNLLSRMPDDDYGKTVFGIEKTNQSDNKNDFDKGVKTQLEDKNNQLYLQLSISDEYTILQLNVSDEVISNYTFDMLPEAEQNFLRRLREDASNTFKRELADELLDYSIFDKMYVVNLISTLNRMLEQKQHSFLLKYLKDEKEKLTSSHDEQAESAEFRELTQNDKNFLTIFLEIYHDYIELNQLKPPPVATPQEESDGSISSPVATPEFEDKICTYASYQQLTDLFIYGLTCSNKNAQMFDVNGSPIYAPPNDGGGGTIVNQYGGQLPTTPGQYPLPLPIQGSRQKFNDTFFAPVQYIASPFFDADKNHDFKGVLNSQILEKINELNYRMTQETMTYPNSQYNSAKTYIESGTESDLDLKTLRDNLRLGVNHEWAFNEAVMAYCHSKDPGLTKKVIIKIIPININNLNDPKNFYKDPQVLKTLGDAGYLFCSESKESSSDDATTKWKDNEGKWHTLAVVMTAQGDPVQPMFTNIAEARDGLFSNVIIYEDNSIPKDVLAWLCGATVKNDAKKDIAGGVTIKYTNLTQNDEDEFSTMFGERMNYYVAGAADPSTTSPSIDMEKFANTRDIQLFNETLNADRPGENDYSKIALIKSLNVFLNIYANKNSQLNVTNITHVTIQVTEKSSTTHHKGIRIEFEGVNPEDLHLKDTSINNIKALVESVNSCQTIVYDTKLNADNFPAIFRDNRIIRLSIVYYNNVAEAYKFNQHDNKTLFMMIILMWKAFGDFWEAMYIYCLNYMFNYSDAGALNNQTRAVGTTTDKNFAGLCLMTNTQVIVGNTSVHLPPLFNPVQTMTAGSPAISLINENAENLITKQTGKALVSNFLPTTRDPAMNIMGLYSDLFDTAVRLELIKTFSPVDTGASTAMEVSDQQTALSGVDVDSVINQVRINLNKNSKSVVDEFLVHTTNSQDWLTQYLTEQLKDVNNKTAEAEKALMEDTISLNNAQEEYNIIESWYDFSSTNSQNPPERLLSSTKHFQDVNKELIKVNDELKKLNESLSTSSTSSNSDADYAKYNELMVRQASLDKTINLIKMFETSKILPQNKKTLEKLLSPIVTSKKSNLLTLMSKILANGKKRSRLDSDQAGLKTMLDYLKGTLQKNTPSLKINFTGIKNLEDIYRIIKFLVDIKTLTEYIGQDFLTEDVKYLIDKLNTGENPDPYNSQDSTGSDVPIDDILNNSYKQTKQLNLILGFHPTIQLLLPTDFISEIKKVYESLDKDYYDKSYKKLMANAFDDSRSPEDELKTMQKNHTIFLNKFNALQDNISWFKGQFGAPALQSLQSDLLENMSTFTRELMEIGERCVNQLNVISQRVAQSKNVKSAQIDEEQEHMKKLNELVDLRDQIINGTNNDINGFLTNLQKYINTYITQTESSSELAHPKRSFTYPPRETYRRLYKMISEVWRLKEEEQFNFTIDNLLPGDGDNKITNYLNRDITDVDRIYFIKNIPIAKQTDKQEIQRRINVYLDVAAKTENKEEIDKAFNELTDINDNDIKFALLDQSIIDQHQKVMESIIEFENNKLLRLEKQRLKEEAEAAKAAAAAARAVAKAEKEAAAAARAAAKAEKEAKAKTSMKGKLTSIFNAVTAAASAVTNSASSVAETASKLAENASKAASQLTGEVDKFFDKFAEKDLEKVRKMIAPIVKEVKKFQKKEEVVVATMLGNIHANIDAMGKRLTDAMKDAKRSAMSQIKSIGNINRSSGSSSSISSSSSQPEGGRSMALGGDFNYKRTAKNRPRKYHKYTRVKHAKMKINKSRKRIKKQQRRQQSSIKRR